MSTAGRGRDTGADAGRAPPSWRILLWPLVVTLLLLWAWHGVARPPKGRTLPYSAFKAHLARREVLECVVRPDDIEGRIASRPAAAAARGPRAAEPFRFRTVRVDDPGLVAELQAAGVTYEGERPGLLAPLLWAWLLPLGLLLVLGTVLLRLGAARAAALEFGKSRAKLIAERSTGVAFDDVAGCDEAKQELQEVVDFLQDPGRYRALGAKIPKGVLLTGPPGTGKTLLARAVAGEAGVPFFCLSGSEFVELFVGVGAARVRDLFAQAKAQAPCIVFIDELDAIGRQRSVHLTTAGDEREQTLNQLLVELDGFAPNSGVIVLAATNRPDVLDRALLRPGRFDRQVVIDAPDLDGREAILRIHARDKPLAANADLHALAQATPGFSGADLANAMNEAALLAARRRVAQIGQQELEEAVEKVVAGPERRSRRLSEELKRRVAYHEAGHALVAAHSRYADPVRKISIVPRGRAALGYTLQLPAGDQLLLTREELVDRIRGLLGGRAAEELAFGGVSTGAEDDLERATALARQMVCRYGMGRSVGLAHVGPRPEALPPAAPEVLGPRDCSEQTAREIDEEVKGLLAEAYAAAQEALVAHRDQLDRVAGELLRRETLEAEALQALLGGTGPNPAAGGRPGAAPQRDGPLEPVGQLASP